MIASVTIDGRRVDTAAGVSVLEAAARAGTAIPVLCYHPALPLTDRAGSASWRCPATRAHRRQTKSRLSSRLWSAEERVERRESEEVPVMKLFAVNDEADHHLGNAACPACSEGYPEPCSCGGLMHGVTTEDTHAGTTWVTTKCEQCGRSEEDVEEELGREPIA